MLIGGVLLAMAVPSWSNYQRNHDFLSSKREMVSTLRAAQSSALAEETTYRIDFVAPRTITTLRFNGTAFVQTASSTLPGNAASITSRNFSKRNGSASQSAYFYARGTASAGQLVLSKTGTSTTARIDVEGLTGRVNTS